METCSFKMSPEMITQVRVLARDRDVTVGQILRDLVSKEISRCQNARPPVRADEQLVAPLRARLASDLALGTDWEDIQERLMAKGYQLQAAGGGLVLQTHPQGERVCKASELGFSYSRLMRRLNAPFPGHPHAWLFEQNKAATDHGPCLIEEF